MAGDIRAEASKGQISELLQELHAPSKEARQSAFYQPLDVGAGGEFSGRTSLMPAILEKLFSARPSEADHIKLALIGLLAEENSVVQAQRLDYEKTGAIQSEEYANYYGDVIAAVCSLNDERSINELLDVLTTGGMVARALARFGPAAIGPVLKKLSSPAPDYRGFVTTAKCRDPVELTRFSSCGRPSLHRQTLPHGNLLCAVEIEFIDISWQTLKATDALPGRNSVKPTIRSAESWWTNTRVPSLSER